MMTRSFAWLVVAAAAVGCTTPQPVRPSEVAPPGAGPIKLYDRPKPDRPPQVSLLPPPPFRDDPLIRQALPEAAAFVSAWREVGSPRIVLFLNRRVDGTLLPVAPRQTLAGVEVATESDRGNPRDTQRITGRAEIYLAPGSYDEAQARSLDYQAIELTLTDWLTADGRVTIVSPMMARQRLSDQEVAELEAGRPTVVREIIEKLDADVLIHVQARPTAQSRDGLTFRVLCEAINTAGFDQHGGQSIARSSVDMPPPLVKTTINDYTRFLARDLMDKMTTAWTQMARDARPVPRDDRGQP